MLRVKKFSWNANDKEAKITYSIERDGSSEKHQSNCPRPTPGRTAGRPSRTTGSSSWPSSRKTAPMNRLRLAIAQWLCPDLRDHANVLSQRNEAIGLLSVIYDWTDHKDTPWARRTKILLEAVLGGEEAKRKVTA